MKPPSTPRSLKAVLQQVVRAEHDRRHAGQGGRLDPAGKVPGNEIRAGQAAITHGSEQQRTRAGHRPRATADAARHFARAHALEPDLLVLHHKVQQHPPLGAEIAHRGGPPGRQAIGVESDAQAFRGTAFIQVRHPALQVALQQPHLLHMVEQAAPEIGGMRRRLAHQDRLADPRLEQLDPLRYRRLRQPQRLCGALETALLHHCGQRGEQLVVEQNQFS